MKRAQPLRRKRKGPDALLTRKCDDAWRDDAKRRVPYCEVCATLGSDAHRSVLHAHHIITRSVRRLRWDPRNSCTLCYAHHRWFAHSGDVLKALDWRIWLKTHRAADWDYVQSHANDVTHYSRADKLAILAELQGELEEAA